MVGIRERNKVRVIRIVVLHQNTLVLQPDDRDPVPKVVRQ